MDAINDDTGASLPTDPPPAESLAKRQRGLSEGACDYKTHYC